MKKVLLAATLLLSPAIAFSARIQASGGGSAGGGGGGGSSSLSIEDGDVQVSSPTATIDFQGAQFTVTESPAGEANVSLNPSSVTLFGTPSLTEGSVLFWSGGILSQDNDNFFWDRVLDRLAVGHKIPTHDLHLSGSALNQFLVGDETGKSLFEVDASLASFGSGTIEFGDIGNNFDGPHFIMDIPGFEVRIESADVGVGGLFSGVGPQSDLDVRGSSLHGIITVATDDTTVTNGEKLGQIDFNAPVEASGTDATLPGASIWAEADASFTSTVNDTDLIFATGLSEAATEKMRLDSSGNLGISTTSPAHKLSVQGGMVVTSSSTFNGNVFISSGVLLNGSAGTNGQIFTSGGSGTIPTWTTISGGGVTVYPATSTILAYQGAIVTSTFSVFAPDSVSSVTIGITDLPVNGGIGPQVAYPYLYAHSNIDSGSIGSFRMLASTQTGGFTTGRSGDAELTITPGESNDSSISLTINTHGSRATQTMSLGQSTFTISGATLQVSGLNCGGKTNGGALTADANGNIVCSDDDGGGSGDVALASTQTFTGANTFSAVVNLSSTVALSNQKKRMFFSATAGMCRISSGCADAIQAETSVSSINYMGSAFANDLDDHWQTSFTLPENYADGTTFTAAVEWTSTGTANGVAWFVQCMSIGDDDAIDTAFGTAVEINDDNTASQDFLRTAESAAITCSGSPIGGDRVWIQVYRDVDDADDDWTGSADFIGMWLTFNIDRLSSED